VIVAVITVRMVQMTIDKIINMIGVFEAVWPQSEPCL
jgi:hypothetical protein